MYICRTAGRRPPHRPARPSWRRTCSRLPSLRGGCQNAGQGTAPHPGLETPTRFAPLGSATPARRASASRDATMCVGPSSRAGAGRGAVFLGARAKTSQGPPRGVWCGSRPPGRAQLAIPTGDHFGGAERPPRCPSCCLLNASGAIAACGVEAVSVRDDASGDRAALANEFAGPGAGRGEASPSAAFGQPLGRRRSALAAERARAIIGARSSKVAGHPRPPPLLQLAHPGLYSLPAVIEASFPSLRLALACLARGPDGAPSNIRPARPVRLATPMHVLLRRAAQCEHADHAALALFQGMRCLEAPFHERALSGCHLRPGCCTLVGMTAATCWPRALPRCKASVFLASACSDPPDPRFC